MNAIIGHITGIFDQLNPFNTANLILYFAWVAIFGFTMVGLVRARYGLVRFLCYALNQFFSVGIILSWTLTVLLAYTYWWQSLVLFVVSLIIGSLTFRSNRHTSL
ncbi:MAG: hypothetical protein R3E60_02035 [Alphaproteobacteria bacterium]